MQLTDVDEWLRGFKRNPIQTTMKLLLVVGVFVCATIIVIWLTGKFSSRSFVHERYTSTQTITPHGGVIDLDSAGTLTLDALKSDANTATAILNAVRMAPKGREEVSAYWYSDNDEYVFNTYDSEKKSRTIVVGERKFLVTLTNILAIDTAETNNDNAYNYEYRFGISEE